MRRRLGNILDAIASFEACDGTWDRKSGCAAMAADCGPLLDVNSDHSCCGGGYRTVGEWTCNWVGDVV